MGWENSITAINLFFELHSPSIWKTRTNDMPLKAVKTTLSHLCKSLGPELLNIIDSCISKKETPIIIKQYAELMLKTSKSSDDQKSSVVAVPSSSLKVENSDPNSNEYLLRLSELRKRYGLEGLPIASTNNSNNDNVSAAEDYSQSETEKKISELRMRLLAVKAPYESNVNSSSLIQISVAKKEEIILENKKEEKNSTNDPQLQLAAIRERLAKFQNKN